MTEVISRSSISIQVEHTALCSVLSPLTSLQELRRSSTNVIHIYIPNPGQHAELARNPCPTGSPRSFEGNLSVLHLYFKISQRSTIHEGFSWTFVSLSNCYLVDAYFTRRANFSGPSLGQRFGASIVARFISKLHRARVEMNQRIRRAALTAA